MGDVQNQQYKHWRKTEELDQEWVELIAEALRMGMTKEEIRFFLKSNGNFENTNRMVKSYKVSGI
ncbi:DNA-binding transcriptional regulator YhcF (GntR family) [Bacillus fengqiuensis]|nr:DNA-binding transcriptional regulator YhcF (GntR family) [Bacillus fengqiuensis]